MKFDKDTWWLVCFLLVVVFFCGWLGHSLMEFGESYVVVECLMTCEKAGIYPAFCLDFCDDFDVNWTIWELPEEEYEVNWTEEE